MYVKGHFYYCFQKIKFITFKAISSFVKLHIELIAFYQ